MDLKTDLVSWQAAEKKLTRSYALVQILSNGVGIVTCFIYFVFFDEMRPRFSERQEYIWVVCILSLFLFILGTAASRYWMRDIYWFVRQKIGQKDVSQDKALVAEKKILNLPAVSALISIFNWGVASLFIPVYFILTDMVSDLPGQEMSELFWVGSGIFFSGLVTSALVFFRTELLCRPVWTLFFPDGEFISVKGIFKLNLLQRILIIFLMASIFPLADMAVVSYEKAELMLIHDPADVLQGLLSLILFLLVVEFSLVLLLSFFMSRSIVTPIRDLKDAMGKVRKGELSARARVMDNNELGELSRHFNHMTDGLKEREVLLRSLAVAKEVQQNLLPAGVPMVTGLDLAGKSVYCDQTGGDYYDFIEMYQSDRSLTVMALGDVSGHGIPSALLMASARAFLRQRIALSGRLDRIVNDVNVQFCRDVGDSGRFMTLFFAFFDPEDASLAWVRAGHDPAFLYDPAQGLFRELKGKGIPLGVDEKWCFQENRISGLPLGSILFIGTDGIWEARNSDGEMFGKKRLEDLIRVHGTASAGTIANAVLESLYEFIGEETLKDDVTLIVARTTA